MPLGGEGPLKRLNFYYGWWIVAGLLFAQVVSSGFGFYNLSVYMNAIVAEHQFSVADASVGVTIFFFTGGVAGLWVGRLLERYDVRWIMTVGAVIGGLGLGMTGFADRLWQFYLLYAIFGIGNTGVGLVIASTLVTRWFPGPNRSVALSISSTGLSLGGVLITPLSARIINEFGFAPVLPWFGFAFIVMLVPLALLIVRVPEAHQIAAATDDAPPPSRTQEWPFGAAVRSRFFLLVSSAYLLCMGAQVGGIAHLYNHGEQLVGYVVAATAVQALTIMSILGRIAGGVIATRVALRPFALANMVVQALGLLLISKAQTEWTLLAGAAVFGASIGNLLMLHPLLLADAFGVIAYPRIYAWSNLFTMFGVSGGPLVLGVLHDLAGYEPAFMAAVGVSLLGFVLLCFAGARPAETEATAR